jgi:hypothetical protein
LQTINQADTPGIRLLSNSAFISTQLNTIDATWLQKNNVNAGELIYDVMFTNIVYAETQQAIANFAFVASSDDTPVVLTSAALERLPYGGPNS